jgi:hypothetical protein
MIKSILLATLIACSAIAELKAQALQSALILSGTVPNSTAASEAPYWVNNTGSTIRIFKVFVAMNAGYNTQKLGCVIRVDSNNYLMATGYWPCNGISVNAGEWLTSEDTFSPYWFELPPGEKLSIYCYSIGGTSIASAEIWYAISP